MLRIETSFLIAVEELRKVRHDDRKQCATKIHSQACYRLMDQIRYQDPASECSFLDDVVHLSVAFTSYRVNDCAYKKLYKHNE